jgi:hypothetical protein
MGDLLKDFARTPASWISLAALILALASLIIQGRQWQKLNRPRIRPMAAHLRSFHTLGATEARSKDWGYTPVMHAAPDDAAKVLVGSRLVLIDPTTNGRILGSHTLLDMADAEREAKRVSTTGPVAIAKQMEFVWGFVNDGSLPAENVEVVQEIAFGDGEFQKFSDAHRQPDLKRGEELYLQPWAIIALDFLPPSVRIRATITYTSDGRPYKEVFATRWDPLRNTWARIQ